MKKLFQLLILLLLSLGSAEGYCQQWNPKIATWIYSVGSLESHGDLRVTYLRDTLVDGHVCQILKKDIIDRLYNLNIYSYRVLGQEVTYYKSGVTYILNNNKFDTLYYFTGNINERYKVTDIGKGGPADKAYAVIADTGSVDINTHKLKWQAVDYYFERLGNHYTIRDTILERIGATKYYFIPWDYISGMVDGNMGGPLNCYKDSTIGVYSTINSTGCTFDLSLVASKKYEPYIGENKVWKKVETRWLTDGSQGPNYLVDHAYFKGDTMVNGFQYYKMYRKLEQPTSENESLAFLMCEDTANQKVYVNDIHFNKSALLYDFKLKKGDEFNSYIIGGVYHTHTVVKADTIFLFNRKLKRIVFDDSIIWVEGIGAINGSYIPSSGELICVTNNNMLMYLNAKYHNCDTVFVQGGGSAVETVKNNDFLLYPNPIQANSMLYVNSINNERLRIEIYSNTGTLIKEDDFTNTYPIGILDLKKGLYLYRISSNRQLIKADKIVIQ